MNYASYKLLLFDSVLKYLLDVDELLSILFFLVNFYKAVDIQICLYKLKYQKCNIYNHQASPKYFLLVSTSPPRYLFRISSSAPPFFRI